MMIVAFGKAFTVAEEAPKKQIMNTLARFAYSAMLRASYPSLEISNFLRRLGLENLDDM